ncbi:MAG: FMN-binding protein, partial [Bacilli bacterium]|nr:FMN-binding protein [Bacilli bacterium]
MAKMKKKWVALCSTAIGAIYVAAYLATETQATMLQPQQQAQVHMQTESSQTQQQLNTPTESSQPQQQVQLNTPTKSSQPQQQAIVNTPTKSSQPQQHAIVNTPTKSSQPQQQPIVNTPTKSSQPKRIYKDGTYTGSGSNRRGSIEVAVTIKNDKITDVEISNFAMHYSESDVVGLPEEVLQKQSS